MIRKIFKYICYLLFLPLWWLQRLFPRDNRLWIFGAWNGLKYSDNAKVLYEYIHKNELGIKCIWLTKSTEIYKRLQAEGKTSAITTSLRGVIYSLKAGCVVFSSGKQDVNMLFINGAKIINTWHGTPMKKIGLDDKFAGSYMKFRLIKVLFPFMSEYNIDTVVSTSDVFSPLMSSAFNLPADKIICSGYPRNDIFFSPLIHPYIGEWDKKFLKPIKIFYLPTFRDHTKSFKPFENYEFNESLMNQFLVKTNSILISKGHFVDNEIGSNTTSERIIHLDDSSVDDLNFLIKDIDILITDYSGVYFDFLLTRKRILFAPFDFDEYLSKHRELYFNYADVICGPEAKNWEEVIIGLDDLINNDNYVELRKQKNSFFNKFHDGNSASRLYTAVKNLIN